MLLRKCFLCCAGFTRILYSSGDAEQVERVSCSECTARCKLKESLKEVLQCPVMKDGFGFFPCGFMQSGRQKCLACFECFESGRQRTTKRPSTVPQAVQVASSLDELGNPMHDIASISIKDAYYSPMCASVVPFLSKLIRKCWLSA
jgi:hypothetical protein